MAALGTGDTIGEFGGECDSKLDLRRGKEQTEGVGTARRRCGRDEGVISPIDLLHGGDTTQQEAGIKTEKRGTQTRTREGFWMPYVTLADTSWRRRWWQEQGLEAVAAQNLEVHNSLGTREPNYCSAFSCRVRNIYTAFGCSPAAVSGGLHDLSRSPARDTSNRCRAFGDWRVVFHSRHHCLMSFE